MQIVDLRTICELEKAKVALTDLESAPKVWMKILRKAFSQRHLFNLFNHLSYMQIFLIIQYQDREQKNCQIFIYNITRHSLNYRHNLSALHETSSLLIIDRAVRFLKTVPNTTVMSNYPGKLMPSRERPNSKVIQMMSSYNRLEVSHHAYIEAMQYNIQGRARGGVIPLICVVW